MTSTLGRIPSPPDPRDDNYPARRLLRTLEPQRSHAAVITITRLYHEEDG